MALCCLSSLVLWSMCCPTFPESILFVLWLDGIFYRLAIWIIGLRLPPIQEDRWVRRNRHTKLRTKKEKKRILLEQHDTLSQICINTLTRVKSSWALMMSTAPFPLQSDVCWVVKQHHWSLQDWLQTHLTLVLQWFSQSEKGTIATVSITERERETEKLPNKIL